MKVHACQSRAGSCESSVLVSFTPSGREPGDRGGQVGRGEADVMDALAPLLEPTAERPVVQRAEELDLAAVRVDERRRGHDVVARLPVVDHHRLDELAGVELGEDRRPVGDRLVEVADEQADVRERPSWHWILLYLADRSRGPLPQAKSIPVAIASRVRRGSMTSSR